jgi:aminodeoxyfutalosine synthase
LTDAGHIKDPTLQSCAEKIFAGERLSGEDGLKLMSSNDLLFLGQLARCVKTRKTHRYAFFNVNKHINLTNICLSRCRFCAFSRDLDDPDAYTMTVDQAVQNALEARRNKITELHVVSGLHPHLPFDYYLSVIRNLRQALPDIHIKAFTAVEIDHFSHISGLSVEEVLLELRKAGLGSLPGGGAEIFSSRVRSMTCAKKASGEQWQEIMETAHRMGIKSNATMLFGHIESDEERIDHLLQLRALQDRTKGFQAFIPLTFHPQNTDLAHLNKPSAWEILKMHAVSRLLLDNFDHIKAFWIMTGVKLAQLALDFGADDLDGTVMEEKITHSAGGQTAQALEKNYLVDLIKEMGLIPVERDTLYNKLQVYEC